MTQENVQEAEFTEVEGAPTEEAPEPKLMTQITISVYDNGGMDVSTAEGMQELQPIEVEAITRQVYDNLRDSRVANSALEAIKQRLA